MLLSLNSSHKYKTKSFERTNIFLSSRRFRFVLFHGFIEVHPSEYSQLRCTVPNLTRSVVCLWYSVGLSQLYGKDSIENTTKNCSLEALKRKNIKVQTAANSFILCSLWKANTAYGEFSSTYKWLKQKLQGKEEREREWEIMGT